MIEECLGCSDQTQQIIFSMLLFLIVEEIVHDLEITEKKKTKEKEIAHNSTKAMYFCSTF